MSPKFKPPASNAEIRSGTSSDRQRKNAKPVHDQVVSAFPHLPWNRGVPSVNSCPPTTMAKATGAGVNRTVRPREQPRFRRFGDGLAVKPSVTMGKRSVPVCSRPSPICPTPLSLPKCSLPSKNDAKEKDKKPFKQKKGKNGGRFTIKGPIAASLIRPGTEVCNRAPPVAKSSSVQGLRVKAPSMAKSTTRQFEEGRPSANDQRPHAEEPREDGLANNERHAANVKARPHKRWPLAKDRARAQAKWSQVNDKKRPNPRTDNDVRLHSQWPNDNTSPLLPPVKRDDSPPPWQRDDVPWITQAQKPRWQNMSESKREDPVRDEFPRNEPAPWHEHHKEPRHNFSMRRIPEKIAASQGKGFRGESTANNFRSSSECDAEGDNKRRRYSADHASTQRPGNFGSAQRYGIGFSRTGNEGDHNALATGHRADIRYGEQPQHDSPRSQMSAISAASASSMPPATPRYGPRAPTGGNPVDERAYNIPGEHLSPAYCKAIPERRYEPHRDRPSYGDFAGPSSGPFAPSSADYAVSSDACPDYRQSDLPQGYVQPDNRAVFDTGGNRSTDYCAAPPEYGGGSGGPRSRGTPTSALTCEPSSAGAHRYGDPSSGNTYEATSAGAEAHAASYLEAGSGYDAPPPDGIARSYEIHAPSGEDRPPVRASTHYGAHSARYDNVPPAGHAGRAPAHSGYGAAVPAEYRNVPHGYDVARSSSYDTPASCGYGAPGPTSYGETGPASCEAPGPTSFGETGAASYEAHGPTGYGASGPSNYGAHGPTSYGASGSSNYGAAAPTGYGATTSSYGVSAPDYGAAAPTDYSQRSGVSGSYGAAPLEEPSYASPPQSRAEQVVVPTVIPDSEIVRGELFELFSVYEPEKLSQIDQLLDHHRGREKKFLEDVKCQYRVGTGLFSMTLKRSAPAAVEPTVQAVPAPVSVPAGGDVAVPIVQSESVDDSVAPWKRLRRD